MGNWLEKHNLKMTLESKHGCRKLNESQLPMVLFSVIRFHNIYIYVYIYIYPGYIHMLSICFVSVVLSSCCFG